LSVPARALGSLLAKVSESFGIFLSAFCRK
jgi:hypothetical protein